MHFLLKLGLRVSKTCVCVCVCMSNTRVDMTPAYTPLKQYFQSLQCNNNKTSISI